MKSFNILLTCSSNKIQLIQWVKKSISKIDCKIKIFAGDTNSNVQSKYFCDQFWHMPSSVKDNYSTILSYCKKNNIKIIIPSSDRDLEFWSIYKNNLKKYKIFVMVSDHKTINSCFDKFRNIPLLTASLLKKKIIIIHIIASNCHISPRPL